ncbi:hypothetical protein [Ekhidna sp.]|uniref:hypothetical protein n=1 Tax=Ekhidna sp. TaxID=2608089 RepID=UPI003C7A7C32
MSSEEEVFRSNTVMILVPGAFFGTALILRNSEFEILTWVLLIIGLVTTIAVVRSFTTITISNGVISIKNLRKSQAVRKEDIEKYTRTISRAKGIETVVWTLHLNEEQPLSISSDLIKDKDGLKQAMDNFLEGKPKKS